MSSRSFNLADLWELVADTIPERTALVCGDRRESYAELEDRSTRLANWFREHGVGPGDHVALYTQNCTEYVEGFIAAAKLRAAGINVNFRYVEDELAYLLADSDAVGVLVHRQYVPRLAAVRDRLPKLRFALWVDDGSGADVGALTGPDDGAYEAALAASDATRDFPPRSNDDPYVIYTGGTTGMPKGVVWRSEDAFYACFGGGDATRMQGPLTDPDALPQRIIDPVTFLPVAPLMHAAGGWTVFMWFFAGGTVVLLPGSLDPHEVWRTIAREKVSSTTVVGDAVMRPLLDAWDESNGAYDISSLFLVASGGAPLSPALRDRFRATFPQLMLVDGYGSSETGAQATVRYTPGEAPPEAGTAAAFTPADATVLDETTLEPIAPGSGAVGRVARTGHIPLRYYNDAAKTAATFVEHDGRRWALTGDMATVEADGSIKVLGRGSQTINTGGEKVHPEEVEAVLRAHPGVYDVLVVGVPDERWGQRVVAVVQPTAGTAPTPDELRDHARAQLAGYKVPKDVRFVDAVVRSPSGKADYRWAASVASDEPARST